MNEDAADGVEFFLRRERARAALCLFVSRRGQSHTHLVGRCPQGGGLEGLGHASCVFFFSHSTKKKTVLPDALFIFLLVLGAFRGHETTPCRPRPPSGPHPAWPSRTRYVCVLWVCACVCVRRQGSIKNVWMGQTDRFFGVFIFFRLTFSSVFPQVILAVLDIAGAG